MGKRKWDRIGSDSRGGWRLRRKYCHPEVVVYVDYAGRSGRKNLPRYRVRVMGLDTAIVLAYSNGTERRWSLGTAKRKGEWIANHIFWLEAYKVIKGEEDGV